jgi:putative transposase
MSQTGSPATQRRYGLARVCRVWELARSTVYLDQARRTGPAAILQKRGPKTRWSDAALIDEILAVAGGVTLPGRRHRKVWARLRWQGEYRFGDEPQPRVLDAALVPCRNPVRKATG